MIDQSHNLKGKVEAMVQTVVTAQELYAKASLVDQQRLAELQDSCSLVAAEELFRDAFWSDVRPLVRSWREQHGLPVNPLAALAEGGYVDRISEERRSKNTGGVSSYA
jgi:L-rhamnose isomerase/sugar isomerase